MVGVSKYYFKHTITGQTISKYIKPHTKICDYIHSLNNIALSMMINDNNYELVIAGLSLGEKADPIDLLSDEQFDTLGNIYYIRPKNIINSVNLECQICYNMVSVVNKMNSNDCLNSCHHLSLCCQSCISNWNNYCLSNGTIQCCPICRQNILTR